jgi:hypothetical protein
MLRLIVSLLPLLAISQTALADVPPPIRCTLESTKESTPGLTPRDFVVTSNRNSINVELHSSMGLERGTMLFSDVEVSYRISTFKLLRVDRYTGAATYNGTVPTPQGEGSFSAHYRCNAARRQF